MSGAIRRERGASPFGRMALFGLLFVGLGAFFLLLYFIGMGDGSNLSQRSAGHARADGLNGYSALSQLLEAEGYQIEQGNQRSSLETDELLVLTPTFGADAEEIGAILRQREVWGPTLVILPKWMTWRVPANISEEDKARVRPDWVSLSGNAFPRWVEELPMPYRMGLESNLGDWSEDVMVVPSDVEALDEAEEVELAPVKWSGLGHSGQLPHESVTFAKPLSPHKVLIEDELGRTLAFYTVHSDYADDAPWVTFVVEPDLMNNYGLADRNRAAAALAIVERASFDGNRSVTFDMTLHGRGQSSNLLTLAFKPPFLAATLCLLLAMLIIGWRAFLRFGPAAVGAQALTFGKSRLVTNGAGLIVRARRIGLLAEPYAAQVERRLARALGMAHHDAEAIDAALARRLPDEEPFSARAARLNNAETPDEILRAAQALDELTRKLQK